jgi:CBS domain-containing protein
METAIERLRSLRVRDVMNSNVVQVSANQTMAEAAAVLVEHHISGAPVVDEHGHCVGILSALDFARRDAASEELPDEFSGMAHAVHQDSPNEPVHIEEVNENFVSAHMTKAVQTIGVEALLLDAARIMCLEHVHRLPVLDSKSRPVGMITSIDVVAALVNALEEFKQ